MAIERMLTEEMPARVLVARVLAEAGIEYVFGISGGHTGRIVSGLSQVQNQVRMMTVREESLAGVMAEVYGRLTRRPGVMIGQGPWVLGNGLLGTLEAYLSSSPMVLLTDFSDAPHFQLHAPYQQATGDWGSWDARRAFGGVTKQVMQAQEPVAAVQATQLAIKHAMSGQPGPVAVLFSHDALAGDVAPDSRPLLDPTRQAFVQIDIEPRNASWNYPAENVVLGDAAQILGQLLEAVRPRADSRGQTAQRRVAQHRDAQGYFNAPKYRSDEKPILPQRVIGELIRNLPENGIVTCDAGENRILMTHFYQTKAAGGFLQAAGSGPMGFGIPAALGAKLVHPDRPVVACVGDGGFAMTMNGLMTAIEHDIPITVVVFNNHALGWVLHGSGPFAAEFKDFDHAAIARAMGCRGVRVEDPAALGPALQEAIASRVPTVIDVITSLKVSFADITSPLANEASPRR